MTSGREKQRAFISGFKEIHSSDEQKTFAHNHTIDVMVLGRMVISKEVFC